MISHHMGKLKRAGLVECEKRGVWIYHYMRADLPASTPGLIRALVTGGPQRRRRHE
jgi:DNA-binding transcriptional ArsR family regulator